MHESSVTEALLGIVSGKLAEMEAGGKKPLRCLSVSIVVGENTGYVGESIQFYFDRYAKGGPCEGAKILVEYVKPKLKCPSCGSLFERKRFEFACPSCGTDGVPSGIGDEFHVSSMEVEEA